MIRRVFTNYQISCHVVVGELNTQELIAHKHEADNTDNNETKQDSATVFRQVYSPVSSPVSCCQRSCALLSGNLPQWRSLARRGLQTFLQTHERLYCTLTWISWWQHTMYSCTLISDIVTIQERKCNLMDSCVTANVIFHAVTQWHPLPYLYLRGGQLFKAIQRWGRNQFRPNAQPRDNRKVI